MSSTKFKVKQVKSGSETGLEAYVELPIDQEETTRLMPSAAGIIDIGSSTLNWGDAYLGDIECGVLAATGDVSCGVLAATGDISAAGLSLSGGLSATHGTFSGNVSAASGDFSQTVSIAGTLTVGSSLNAAGTVAIENRTFVPPPGVNDLEFRSVNNMYVTLDTDESGSDSFFRIRRVNGGSYLNEFEVTEGGVCKSNEFSSIDGSGGVLLHSEDGVTLSTQASKNPDFKITSTELQTFTKTLVLGNGVKGFNDSKVEVKKGLSIPNGESIQCRTIEPSPSASDIELRAVNDLYFSLDSDDDPAATPAKVTFRKGSSNSQLLEVTYREPGGSLVTELNSSNNIEVNSSKNIVLNIDDGGSDSYELLVKQNGNTILKVGSTEDTGPVYSTDINIPIMGNANYTNGYDLVWLHTAENGKPVGQVVADNTGFTGCHRYLIKAGESIQLGDAVQLDPDLKIKKTTEASSAACVGIAVAVTSYGPYEDGFAGVKPVDSLGRVPGDSGSAETMVTVASVGDSVKGSLRGFKVCNEGGEISAGDLLVTSSVPGRLMKQADDIIRASTVGKAMQAVTFNDQGQADDVYGFLYCG